jgi:hypothetical protein
MSRRRLWVWSGSALIAIALAIQLVPYGRDHVNPPPRREPAWDSASTRDLAKRACFDCHSNETEWPPYAKFAPASWLVQHDVAEGRAVLNFSEWHRAQRGATDASEEVRHREMPPVAYRLMHPHARLSVGDIERLASGLAMTMGASAPASSEDPSGS